MIEVCVLGLGLKCMESRCLLLALLGSRNYNNHYVNCQKTVTLISTFTCSLLSMENRILLH